MYIVFLRGETRPAVMIGLRTLRRGHRAGLSYDRLGSPNVVCVCVFCVCVCVSLRKYTSFPIVLLQY